MISDNKNQPQQTLQNEDQAVQPKGQDFLKTDAEGAGSDAREFAGGARSSSEDNAAKANDEAGTETVGIP